MSAIAETLQDSRKIVIKVGSNVMSTPDGHIDREAVGSIVEQINVMVNDGKEIIVVSSGAGAFGAGAINKLVRRKDVHYYQALCAIGQVEMMMAYKEFFGKNGTHGRGAFHTAAGQEHDYSSASHSGAGAGTADL